MYCVYVGKTHTSLLLDQHERFLAFGSKAREDYYECDETGSFFPSLLLFLPPLCLPSHWLSQTPANAFPDGLDVFGVCRGGCMDGNADGWTQVGTGEQPTDCR